MKRNGCARSQLGKVFVENRECTMAKCVAKSGLARSAKYCSTCSVFSIPL